MDYEANSPRHSVYGWLAMNRLRLLIHILLIAAVIAVPTVTAFAQDAEPTDCGFLGIQCGFIPDILSGILDIIRGIADFIFNAITGAIDLVRGIAEWLITAIGNVIQLIINLVQPIIDIIAGILRLLVEIVNIIVLLIQIVVGFFVIMAAIMVQSVLSIGSILSSYYTAPVTAIPGLPLCVTDPTTYEICSIYYMADWTLFAPNTPGAIIVPLVVILLDVVIIIFFVRRIIGILNVGEKATDV